MPATVTSLLTNITLANDSTGFDTWKRDGGGGTPSAIDETDVYLQGTGSCSVKVSNQGVVIAYGAGGLNLSGQHLYIWVNMLAGGLMTTRAANGLCIFVSSSATISGGDYQFWAVDGSDTYPGGWVRYVIDLSKTATLSVGTLNLASVQWVGMYCDTRPNVARFDNLVIDRIDYGSGPGLQISGTSTVDALFEDARAADEGTIANKYGVLVSKEGVLYARAGIEINGTDLSDTDTVLVFEDPKYWDGAAEQSCIGSGKSGLTVAGTSTVRLGHKVGTGDSARGRNGITLINNAPGGFVDLSDTGLVSLGVYGCKFQGFDGLLQGNASGSHELIGTTIDGCSQFDPIGAIVMRNNTFSGYKGADAALLWNSSIDIKNCAFIANADAVNDPAGIEHTTADTVTYDSLTFSGNDADIYLSALSGTLTVNAVNGTDASTSRADGTSVVSIVNSVLLTLSGLVPGSRVYIRNTTDGIDLVNVVEATSVFSQSFNYAGDKALLIRIRNASGGTKYKPFQTTGTLTSSGFSLIVNQELDQ